MLIFSFIGDEVYSINGTSVSALTHQETIAIFKEVKQGEIVMTIGRRGSGKINSTPSNKTVKIDLN